MSQWPGNTPGLADQTKNRVLYALAAMEDVGFCGRAPRTWGLAVVHTEWLYSEPLVIPQYTLAHPWDTRNLAPSRYVLNEKVFSLIRSPPCAVALGNW